MYGFIFELFLLLLWVFVAGVSQTRSSILVIPHANTMLMRLP